MRQRVSRIACLVPLLISLASAGCGEVESGVCAGEQVDEVSCTVDICDGEAKAWAHIPNDALCEVGQRCDPTAGCVAAGGLTGHATLFAHTDHSGITVSIDGLEGATAMTDAMGNWSMSSLPTGTYDVTYTKGTFVTQTQSGVGVLPSAATSPPDVELRHGADLGVDQNVPQMLGFYGNDYGSNTYLSPDKKHAVVRFFLYYVGTTYRSYKLDGLSSAPVDVFFNTYPYDPDNGVDFRITDTHFVWSPPDRKSVWARPLDGGPAVILGTVAPQDSLLIAGTPGTYTMLRKVHNTGVYDEDSLYVVKTDGSTPMGSPAFVTADAQHDLVTTRNNDTTAVVFLTNSTASPTAGPTDGSAQIPLRRIDFASGAVSSVNVGFATNYADAWSVSPDNETIFGYFRQDGINQWFRSFMMPISGTVGPKLAPSYGAANPMYSDRPASGPPIVWLPDNSAVVYASASYAAGEGGLKSWATTAATSTQLVTAGNYYVYSFSVHNKVVLYRNTSASTAQLLAVAAVGATPTPYTLDSSGSFLNDFQYDDTDPASSYIVWTQSVSGGDSTRAKIFSSAMPSPLLAAPSAVQLGGTLNPTCSYEGVLSDRTYWQLCANTGVLSGFTQSTTTAGTQTQQVLGGLMAAPGGDSIVFRQYDNKLYSSPNTGTLTDVRLVSTQWENTRPIRVVDKWVVFTDSGSRYLRASNVTGSGIDEPLSTCLYPPQNANQNGGRQWGDPMNTTFLFTEMRCTNNDYGEYQVPSTNLP
jgi:hypothetical protein